MISDSDRHLGFFLPYGPYDMVILLLSLGDIFRNIEELAYHRLIRGCFDSLTNFGIVSGHLSGNYL